MASFGHVAVGLWAGRLHGGPPGRPDWRSSPSTAALALFAALSMLPDADVFLVALGASDKGAIGHRGASHSLAFAVAGGLLCAMAAQRLRWPVLRTALYGALALASHPLLDALGAGGRGLMLLWPFSFTRFHSPWRVFPDAPRGVKLFSQAGLIELAVELVIFSPLTAYALWPQIRDRVRRSSWRRRPPDLRLIEGAADAARPVPGPQPIVPDDDPRLRSSG
jgi:inner membrane protein